MDDKVERLVTYREIYQTRKHIKDNANQIRHRLRKMKREI